jgi:hypothetical protein
LSRRAPGQLLQAVFGLGQALALQVSVPCGACKVPATSSRP